MSEHPESPRGEKMVQCRDCGQLEFGGEWGGYKPATIAYRREPSNGRPRCAWRAWDLDAELAELEKSGTAPDLLLNDVIRRPRPCNAFVQFIPGLEPVEHTRLQIEDFFRKAREESEARWRKDREETEARWRQLDEQAATRREIEDRRWRRRDFLIAGSNLLVAVAAVLIAIFK